MEISYDWYNVNKVIEALNRCEELKDCSSCIVCNICKSEGKKYLQLELIKGMQQEIKWLEEDIDAIKSISDLTDNLIEQNKKLQKRLKQIRKEEFWSIFSHPEKE